MKVGIFHTTLPQEGRKLGGVEVYVHRLASELNVKVQQVTVFSLDDKPKGASYNHVKMFKNHAWLYKNKLCRLFLMPWLLNFVKFDDCDLIHFHGDDWFYIKRSKPSLRTFNGSAKFEAKSATSLKRKIIQNILYPLEKVASNFSTKTAGLGKETAELHETHYIANCGVNLDVFKPSDKTSHPSICFIGTLEGRKRGNFLVDVFLSEILPVYPNAILQIISDKQPLVHDNIHWVKYPSDEELARILASSWVFAYPSTYEGFGIPYIEALASGTAVVCSANTGAEYVLDEGKYGNIVADQDFGQKIIHLLQDAERRQEQTQRGLEYVTKFSWDAVCQQHMEMYRQTLGNLNYE